jgi:HEAT repeat protein
MLSSLLTIAQHRLRAAEELSRLKDPAAEKVLEQVRLDPKSSVDEKATATIALFRAGHAELAADVRTLLGEPSWKTFAAQALGEAKDDAAKPVLVEQLQHGLGVKVRAAYALRKLVNDPPDDLVAPLAAQLESLKDQEQILAAEAILILAGEPQWSEYQ